MVEFIGGLMLASIIWFLGSVQAYRKGYEQGNKDGYKKCITHVYLVARKGNTDLKSFDAYHN